MWTESKGAYRKNQYSNFIRKDTKKQQLGKKFYTKQHDGSYKLNR